ELLEAQPSDQPRAAARGRQYRAIQQGQHRPVRDLRISNFKFEILFEDANYVAISKPSGLASIPGRGETNSAFEQVAKQLNLPHRGETDPRLRLVHRIDKDTSGLLLFAKNKNAQRHASHQF